MQLIRRGDSGAAVKKWQSFLVGQGYTNIEVDGDFGKNTEFATKQFQDANGLKPEGIVGNKTYAAAAIKGFPIISDVSAYPPKPDFPYPSNEQRDKMLGKLPFQHLGGGKIKILDNWDKNNIVMVHIPQLAGIKGAPANCKVAFHKAGVPQLKALFIAWEKAGLLHYIESWAGTFNPRMIRGSTRQVSNHAYASAFDINAAWNGLGIAPPTAFEKGTVVPLVAIANAHGFFWGGHYNNRKDGMHFELAVLNRFPKNTNSVEINLNQNQIPQIVQSTQKDSAAPSPIASSEANGIQNADFSADFEEEVFVKDETPEIPDFADEMSENAGNAAGKISETIEETKKTAEGEIKKTTEAVTDTFNPLNLPAFIPRFGKQWLIGLIPTGFSLATLGAALNDAPWWIVFMLGFITGCATLGFLQLVVKYRETVGQFMINCYKTTADPQMHNLIPTQAKAFVGVRKNSLLSALRMTKPANEK